MCDRETLKDAEETWPSSGVAGGVSIRVFGWNGERGVLVLLAGEVSLASVRREIADATSVQSLLWAD